MLHEYRNLRVTESYINKSCVVLCWKAEMNTSEALYLIEISKEQALASGITALVCCLVLILILVTEIFYMCRYRTTFFQRLFLYLTIVVALANGVAPVWLQILANKTIGTLTLFDNVFFAIYYSALVTELILIASINYTVLSKMYMYEYGTSVRRQSFQSNVEYMLCCCPHTKCKEAIFLLTMFIVTFLWLALLIWSRIANFIAYGILAWPIVINLVLSLVSTATLIVWFCRLGKKKLLRNKMKLACKKSILVTGSLTLFFLTWLPLVTVFIFYNVIPATIFLTLMQVIIPIIFSAHLCANIYKKRKGAKKKDNIAITAYPTIPPSTRVSLPSDTAAHAPNFLSPSTAEPTEAV